jgi:hypothetical protein
MSENYEYTPPINEAAMMFGPPAPAEAAGELTGTEWDSTDGMAVDVHAADAREVAAARYAVEESYDASELVEDDTEQSRESSLGGKAAALLGKTVVLGATAGTYIYEQSPENEKFRTRRGLDALVEASNWVEGLNNRWVETAVKAGAVAGTVGGVTMVLEATCGLVTAATISIKDGLVGKFNRGVTWLADKVKVTDKHGKPKGDVAVALAAGATPLVIKKNAEAGGDRPFKENAKTALKGAAGIAAFSGALGGATAIAIDTADLHNHQELALDAIDVLGDGKTWWALYGGILGWSALKAGSLYGARRLSAWELSRGAVRQTHEPQHMMGEQLAIEEGAV